MLNEDAGTLRVDHQMTIEIDLKLTFQDEADMVFFTPVRWEKLGRKLDEPNLLFTLSSKEDKGATPELTYPY